jgi:hypothetical protein
LITDEEGEFDQNVIIFYSNFKIEYEPLEAHNGSHYVIVLIKNVITSKGDRYLKVQHYTILTKVVDEAT